MVCFLVEVNVFHGPGELVVVDDVQSFHVQEDCSKEVLASEGNSHVVDILVAAHGESDDAELVQFVFLDVFLAAVVHEPQQTDVGPLGPLVRRLLLLKRRVRIVDESDGLPADDVVVHDEAELAPQPTAGNVLRKPLGSPPGSSHCIRSGSVHHEHVDVVVGHEMAEVLTLLLLPDDHNLHVVGPSLHGVAEIKQAAAGSTTAGNQDWWKLQFFCNYGSSSYCVPFPCVAFIQQEPSTQLLDTKLCINI